MAVIFYRKSQLNGTAQNTEITVGALGLEGFDATSAENRATKSNSIYYRDNGITGEFPEIKRQRVVCTDRVRKLFPSIHRERIRQ